MVINPNIAETIMKGMECPVCHTKPEMTDNRGNTYFTMLSVDTFCSADCRRKYYLDRGCVHCHKTYDNTSVWHLGSFRSYIETQIVCDRCWYWHPMYEDYVKSVETTNSSLKRQMGELRQDLYMEEIEVEGDEVRYTPRSDYDDVYAMTIDDLRRAIRLLESFDTDAWNLNIKRIEEEIENLQKQIVRPVEYLDWLPLASNPQTIE